MTRPLGFGFQVIARNPDQKWPNKACVEYSNGKVSNTVGIQILDTRVPDSSEIFVQFSDLKFEPSKFQTRLVFES